MECDSAEVENAIGAVIKVARVFTVRIKDSPCKKSLGPAISNYPGIPWSYSHAPFGAKADPFEDGTLGMKSGTCSLCYSLPALIIACIIHATVGYEWRRGQV